MASLTTISEEQAVFVPIRSFAAGDVLLSSSPWVWSFANKYSKTLCAQCFRDSDSLRVCSSCMLYRYCDILCQSIDWEKEHKYECEHLKNLQKSMHDIPTSKHVCIGPNCGEPDCSTTRIFIAKVFHKITRSGCNEQAETLAMLNSLPYDGAYDELVFTRHPCLRQLYWSTARVYARRIPGFYSLVKRIYYNIFPIFDQYEKGTLIAMGLFPQALHREMTAVCWDINVTMDLQGRKLVVRAATEIPDYTGLKNLRQNELMPMSFCVTLETRRKLFSTLYLRPCNCHGCTKEFDMQINPLKCWNKTCATRIENEEDTAWDACPKCQRPSNSYCFTKFIELSEVYDAVIARRHKPKELGGRLYRLEYSDIVQPYAHFRFVCGICSVGYLKRRGEYEKAWNLSCGLVECVRAIYPKYHLTRASWLMMAGVIPFSWARKMLDEKVEMKETEAERLKCLFTEMLLKASEWLSEAREIYAILSGVDSKWADRIAAVMTLHPKLQERCAGSRVILDALRNDLLLDELNSVTTDEGVAYFDLLAISQSVPNVWLGLSLKFYRRRFFVCRCLH